MTPREKAVQLVDDFWSKITYKLGEDTSFERAKDCVIICVDEKIETLKMVNSFVGLEGTEEYDQFYKEELEELQEVKTEIEKL